MNEYTSGSLINDRYEVTRTFEGGMGIVYLCMDHEKERPVALKTFKPEYLPDREARDRFLREGTAWIELGSHSHIVRCYGVEHSERGEIFLVLEQVAKEQRRDDPSLRSWLQPDRPLPIDQALLFALQIARGMKHATKKIPGFVHRDLKPENVLVGADYITGANINRLRVTDFGLASVSNVNLAPMLNRQLQNVDLMKRTQHTRGIVGTPLYMSPEQWKGESISVATDVYALGCILYEMLAGRTLVIGNTLDELGSNHVNRKYSLLPSGLPEILINVLRICLASNPENRYTDWGKAVTALENVYRDIAHKAAPAEDTAQDISRVEQVSIGLGYVNLGQAYMDIGKTETAFPYFERALSIAQKHGDKILEFMGLAGLGRSRIYLGDTDQGIAYTEKALKISRNIDYKSGESALLDELGTIYKNMGHTQRALEYHEKALEIVRQIGDRRGEMSCLNNLGVDYKTLGDVKRALECYKQALILNDEFDDKKLKVNILINMGVAYKHLNAIQDAIRCQEQALAIAREIGDRHDQGVCLSNLGTAYLVMGDAKKAVNFFEQSIKICKETGARRGEGIGMMNLGQAYAILGDSVQAISILDQSVILFEEVGDLNRKSNALYLKSGTLAQNGDVTHAMLLAKESLRIWTQLSAPEAKLAKELLKNLNEVAKENKPGVWSSLFGKKNTCDDLEKLLNDGINLLENGRYEEAIRCFDQVLKSDPRNVGALGGKGLCLDNLGRYEEAIRYYDKALNISPHNVTALHGNSVCHNNLSRYKEAIHYCDKALEINPRDVIALSLKGYNLACLGQHEESIRYCDKTLEITPRDVRTLITKSFSLDKIGRKQEAVQSYKIFLALAPTEYAEQIKVARQRIRELEGR